MNRILLTIVTVLALSFAYPVGVWAYCTTQTIVYPDGQIVVCTTCCSGRNCTTTCF